MSHRRILIILFHFIGCVSFLGLPFLFAPDSGFKTWMNTPPGRRDLISGVMLIAFFYLNFYKLLPAFYFNGKRTVYFLLVVVCFAAVIFIPSMVTGGYHGGPEPPPPNAPSQDFNGHNRQPPTANRQPPTANRQAPTANPPSQDFDGHSRQPPTMDFRPPHGRPGPFGSGPQFFMFLVVFLFSMGLAVHDRWRMEERERIRVELHYLKSQLNPHFLFNAMNGIYSLTLEKSDQAPKAVLMLSSMMRYVFSRDREVLVPLREEMEYISNYISLQRLRYGDELRVEYISEGDVTGKTIAPMILVPLIENAFKHGVNMEADSYIRIRIRIGTEGLEMEVFNHKVPLVGNYESPSGIGVRNTKNRLALQYPGAHTLSILDENNTFTSLLHIRWIS